MREWDFAVVATFSILFVSLSLTLPKIATTILTFFCCSTSIMAINVKFILKKIVVFFLIRNGNLPRFVCSFLVEFSLFQGEAPRARVRHRRAEINLVRYGCFFFFFTSQSWIFISGGFAPIYEGLSLIDSLERSDWFFYYSVKPTSSFLNSFSKKFRSCDWAYSTCCNRCLVGWIFLKENLLFFSFGYFYLLVLARSRLNLP